MLNAARLHGLFPAIPTPVKADDTIDANAVAALFAWLLKQGIDGVVPLGGTGEYGALSRAERIRMTGMSVKAMAGKGPVMDSASRPTSSSENGGSWTCPDGSRARSAWPTGTSSERKATTRSR